MHYLQQPAADYVKAAVWAAAELHRCGLPGDILIFLTGQPSMPSLVVTQGFPTLLCTPAIGRASPLMLLAEFSNLGPAYPLKSSAAWYARKLG